MSAIPNEGPFYCTNCGSTGHDEPACPDRCALCGDVGIPGDSDTHRECWEADAAGADLPEGESGRAAWRKANVERYHDQHDLTYGEPGCGQCFDWRVAMDRKTRERDEQKAKLRLAAAEADLRNQWVRETMAGNHERAKLIAVQLQAVAFEMHGNPFTVAS